MSEPLMYDDRHTSDLRIDRTQKRTFVKLYRRHVDAFGTSARASRMSLSRTSVARSQMQRSYITNSHVKNAARRSRIDEQSQLSIS